MRADEDHEKQVNGRLVELNGMKMIMELLPEF
jgi:hypothetical protein